MRARRELFPPHARPRGFHFAGCPGVQECRPARSRHPAWFRRRSPSTRSSGPRAHTGIVAVNKTAYRQARAGWAPARSRSRTAVSCCTLPVARKQKGPTLARPFSNVSPSAKCRLTSRGLEDVRNAHELQDNQHDEYHADYGYGIPARNLLVQTAFQRESARRRSCCRRVLVLPADRHQT